MNINEKEKLLKAIKSLVNIIEDIVAEYDAIGNKIPKKGDWITVEKKPESWSSRLNENSPLDLVFPVTLKVREIDLAKYNNPFREKKDTHTYISASAGGYGWALTNSNWRYATKEEIMIRKRGTTLRST